MKKKKRFTYDWSLLMSAAICFVFGKFVAPKYEEMLRQIGLEGEFSPYSKYSLILSGILLVCLFGLWGYRLFSKKSK